MKVEYIKEWKTKSGTSLVKVVMGSIDQVKKIMEGKVKLKGHKVYGGMYLFPDIPIQRRIEWQNLQGGGPITYLHDRMYKYAFRKTK